MVIARLTGGIGNQMFQYAFGRHLSIRSRQKLYLDISRLTGRPNTTPRSLKINIFNIEAPVIQLNELRNIVRPWLVLKQADRGFFPEVFDIVSSLDLFIEGYWVNEQYFSPIADIIRSDFTLGRTIFDASYHELQHAITSTCSVCIHVRRGDYLSPQGDFLGFVGLEYYERAIELIHNRLPDSRFFIFSDDIAWCMQNFVFQHAHTFVAHADDTVDDFTEQDLQLMSMCKHFIIANSTFSWWAAWLGSGDEKIVIAPKRWYTSDQRPTSVVTPAPWLLL